MKKESKETHILYTENNSENNIISFLTEELKSHSADNVIVDVSGIELTDNTLSELNKISDSHKENGMSFVTVVSGISPDDVEETFVICPTLQEAEDIIVMENLERELGF
jgi:cell division GTPase FtsZ